MCSIWLCFVWWEISSGDCGWVVTSASQPATLKRPVIYNNNLSEMDSQSVPLQAFQQLVKQHFSQSRVSRVSSCSSIKGSIRLSSAVLTSCAGSSVAFTQKSFHQYPYNISNCGICEATGKVIWAKENDTLGKKRKIELWNRESK